MSRRQIGLVVFDLGRVMVRLCDGWKHACERAGVPYRPGLDSSSNELRDKVLHLVFLCETGVIDQAEWARRVGEVTGMTPEHADAVSYARLDGPFPGWHALLDKLAEAEIRTACLSNTNAVHWKLMSAGDGPHRLPLQRLTYRFASHLIGAHKPDPAIYRHVEKNTGITPRAILFFDDAGPNVLAARDRGWAAQVIETDQDPVTQITKHLIGYGVLK